MTRGTLICVLTLGRLATRWCNASPRFRGFFRWAAPWARTFSTSLTRTTATSSVPGPSDSRSSLKFDEILGVSKFDAYPFYIHIFIYLIIHLHIIYIYIHAYTYIYIYIHAYTYIYIYIIMCIYIYIHIQYILKSHNYLSSLHQLGSCRERKDGFTTRDWVVASHGTRSHSWSMDG